MQPETTAMERVAAIQRHLMSRPAAADLDDETLVSFSTDGCLQIYTLNRTDKLNAMNATMFRVLRSKIEEWIVLGTPCVIVGAGNGRAFCAGGDIELCIVNISQPETRYKIVHFFHKQYELDYILTNMPLPYIAIMDGATMGAGAGLTAGAAFRIATEHTVFAMPEVQIGYCPDVGCSHFLTRADGEIGTYLALTSESLRGQAVYEHGFATHYILSENIPNVLQQVAALINPTTQQIDTVLREHSAELTSQGLRSHLSGGIRAALDSAFRHHSVEQIVEELTQYAKHNANQDVCRWAARTLKTLSTGSPTSLKVSLALLRRGKNLPLLDALQMELNMTTAYCNGSGPDIFVGSNAMLDGQLGQRLPWYPDTLEKVSDTYIQENFFSKYSPDKGTAPRIDVPGYLVTNTLANPMRFALPSEEEIRQVVEGNHPSGHGPAHTLEDLIMRVDALTQRKTGTRQKVIDVVSRRCAVDQESAHLQWMD